MNSKVCHGKKLQLQFFIVTFCVATKCCNRACYFVCVCLCVCKSTAWARPKRIYTPTHSHAQRFFKTHKTNYIYLSPYVNTFTTGRAMRGTLTFFAREVRISIGRHKRMIESRLRQCLGQAVVAMRVSPTLFPSLLRAPFYGSDLSPDLASARYRKTFVLQKLEHEIKLAMNSGLLTWP